MDIIDIDEARFFLFGFFRVCASLLLLGILNISTALILVMALLCCCRHCMVIDWLWLWLWLRLRWLWLRVDDVLSLWQCRCRCRWHILRDSMMNSNMRVIHLDKLLLRLWLLIVPDQFLSILVKADYVQRHRHCMHMTLVLVMLVDMWMPHIGHIISLNWLHFNLILFGLFHRRRRRRLLRLLLLVGIRRVV